jgi:predicted GIY-YIG superfamily endonuclease
MNEYYQPLTLHVVRPLGLIPSDHQCYILKSTVSNRIYIGYTVDFPHRLRQHNGEITGGAKKTQKWRPWYPICTIQGFYEKSSALRFEYRLQHPGKKKPARTDAVAWILEVLVNLINNGDGSIAKDNKMPWPAFHITWYGFHGAQYRIEHPQITNGYHAY